MSYTIWLKDGLPARQLVPPENPGPEYEKVTVYDQDEVDDIDTCCPGCRADHYQEGYDDAKSEVEHLPARIEELEQALRDMHEEITNAEVDLTDAKAILGSVEVVPA